MRGRKNWGSLLFLVQIMNKTNKSTIRQQESLLERESGKKRKTALGHTWIDCSCSDRHLVIFYQTSDMKVASKDEFPSCGPFSIQAWTWALLLFDTKCLEEDWGWKTGSVASGWKQTTEHIPQESTFISKRLPPRNSGHFIQRVCSRTSTFTSWMNEIQPLQLFTTVTGKQTYNKTDFRVEFPIFTPNVTGFTYRNRQFCNLISKPLLVIYMQVFPDLYLLVCKLPTFWTKNL